MLPSSVGKKIILKDVFPIAGITWKKATSLATWNGPSLTNCLSQTFFLTIPVNRYLRILAPLIYAYHESPRMSKQINIQQSKRKYQRTHRGLRARQLSPWVEPCASYLSFILLFLPHVFKGLCLTHFHLHLSKENHRCTDMLLLSKSQGQRLSGWTVMIKILGSPLLHFLSPSIKKIWG